MTTIKEIKEALNKEENWQDWMDDIQKDERDGVQKALKTWQRQLEKRQKVRQEHEAKEAFDAQFRINGSYIAGTDEAGRGPLAGPVVTAAVILPENCPELMGLNDSKQLSSEKREAFMALVQKHALASTIHFQSEEAIDTFNIYEATRRSMKEAIENLSIKPDFVLADAMTLEWKFHSNPLLKVMRKV